MGCEACGTQQPERMVDFWCLYVLNGFSESLPHTRYFECLVMFPLVVEINPLDIQCLCVIYHLYLDIP